MRPGSWAAFCVAAALPLLSAPGLAQQTTPAGAPLPAGSLAVRVNGQWRTWWSSEASPMRWAAANVVVQRAVVWRQVRPGLERGELRLAAQGPAARFQIVLVRLDPRLYQLRLRQATRDYGQRGAWTLDSASANAVLAVNAGQFEGGDPWGWLVREGRELQPPGKGPLATAVVLEGGEAPALLSPGELVAVRAQGRVREAFQSYPTLLEGDGEVPAPVRRAGLGVDVDHRDARLALGTLPDGRLLIALTRYAGLGDVLSNLPVGPTTPEMAALMGALGCRRAVMLDGGISSQLLLRDSSGMPELWPGLRRVPLAMEAVPRS